MEGVVIRNGTTVREFKELPIPKIIQYIRFLKNDDVKNYMCNWLYSNHYSKIELQGTLLTRVRKLNSNICLNFITNVCFDNYDFENNKNVINLDKTKLNHIININKIYPSIGGLFWKSVIQRIINSSLKINSNYKLNSVSDSIRCDSIVWQFRYKKCNNMYIEYCNFYSIMSTDSQIGKIPHGNMFIELDRIDTWMKIKYKDIVGFVVIEDNENNCFHRIEYSDYHMCEECNYSIYSVSNYGSKLCYVNICRNLCSEIVNNFDYNTKDILIEILINSLNVIDAVNHCPDEENINK